MPPRSESSKGDFARKPRTRRPRPGRKGKAEPTGLGDILDGMIATTPLGTQLEHARIWEHWAEVAGPTVSQHARPVTVRDGELVIEAESAVWMHKVNYKRWQLIRHINRMAKKELVHGIYVILRDGEWDEDDAAMTD